MSEQAAEPGQAQEPEAVELPNNGDLAFGVLMDTLVDAEESAQADEGTATASTDADAAGQAAAAPEGAGAEAAPVAASNAGDGGDSGASTESTETTATEQPSGDLPADWTRPSSELIPKLGELSTALEERTVKAYHTTALEEVKVEHAKYFEALEKHPRLLVGQSVPRIGGEGEETLRDTADAREWQEAVKSILVDEVKGRASKAMDENKDFMTTLHDSIELFQNNADLIPGTKDFNVELANKFAAMAKPYELRVEGKLQGYTIPVQPIINQLRADLAASKAAAPAAAKQSAQVDGKQAQQQTQASTEDPPQAGIQSKAGNSSEAEDFSALFGTIGLPNLRI